MRTQISGKPLFLVIVISAICGVAAVLAFGTSAPSKGQAPEPAAAIVKAALTEAKPAMPVSRPAAQDESPKDTSWKQWPSLTDF
jgi:uncharacterized membrane protein YadS